MDYQPARILFFLPVFFASFCAPQSRSLLVNSFEDPAVVHLLAVTDAEATVYRQHATHGSHSLKITFSAAQWPGVAFETGRGLSRGDWRGYGALVFDAFNPGKQPLTLWVRIDDRRGFPKYSVARGIDIPPGEPVTVALGFSEENLTMSAGPPAFIGDINLWLTWNSLDFGHIASFRLFLANPQSKRTLYVDNVRLIRAVSLEGIVDRFGQYAKAEWPGKVHREEELRRRRTREAKELEHMSLPPDRDSYGGWLGGPRLRTTGWFRTARVGGKWWLVSPEGHLFWALGVDSVGRKPWTLLKGREYMFRWLPPAGHPLHRFTSGDGRLVDFFSMNLYRKYGENYLNQWLEVVRRRLTVWGINTLGAWGDHRLGRRLKIPYTPWASTAATRRIRSYQNTMPDVYDPDWPRNVEECLTRYVSSFASDPYCIGFFVDNELPWAHWNGSQPYAFILNALEAGPDLPAKAAFARLLESKYNSITRLNAVWGTHLQSWREFVAQPVRPHHPETEAVRSDLSMLLSHYAEKYFQTIATTLRRLAPHKLYLGCRFAGSSPEALAMAAKYCDVVSFNMYGSASVIERRAGVLSKLGKPVIISEFHFGALDRGMFSGGLYPVRSQAQRGQEYEAYVRAALRQPWCVGAIWFQFHDQPLTGFYGFENHNIGFISVADRPYPELTQHVRQVGSGLYTLRGSS